MASKKSSKKSSSKKSFQSTLNNAAAAGDANAALMAVSTPASADDAKRDAVFGCIVSTFFAQGFPHIRDETSVIVWPPIPDNVIILLANGITGCITSKGYQAPLLAGAFLNLKSQGQSTVVGDLVAGIVALVKP